MQNSNKNEDIPEDSEMIDKPSYTYWKRESDKPFSTDFTPQKLNTTNTQINSNQNSQGSAWNKAGTW